MYPDGRTDPGLVIFRFDAPLIFANARTFREQMHELPKARPRWIVIAAEPITDVDTTASECWRNSIRGSTLAGSLWCSRR